MERSKTLPRNEEILTTQTNFNRGFDTSRTDDKTKNYSVGLLDIDAAVMYYFREVIKPEVIDNGEVVKVPVYYANPERWKSIQKLGYLRDVKGQFITPLLILKEHQYQENQTIFNTFITTKQKVLIIHLKRNFLKKTDLHKLQHYLKMMNH